MCEGRGNSPLGRERVMVQLLRAAPATSPSQRVVAPQPGQSRLGFQSHGGRGHLARSQLDRLRRQRQQCGGGEEEQHHRESVHGLRANAIPSPCRAAATRLPPMANAPRTVLRRSLVSPLAPRFGRSRETRCLRAPRMLRSAAASSSSRATRLRGKTRELSCVSYAGTTPDNGVPVGSTRLRTDAGERVPVHRSHDASCCSAIRQFLAEQAEHPRLIGSRVCRHRRLLPLTRVSASRNRRPSCAASWVRYPAVPPCE